MHTLYNPAERYSMQSKRRLVTDLVQDTIQEVIGITETIPGSLPFVMHDRRRICILEADELGPALYAEPQQLSFTDDPIKDIRQDGCIDAGDFYEIVVTLEYRTGVEYPNETWDRVRTVNDLISYTCKIVPMENLRHRI